MGKPKKGGYPPPQPRVLYITVENGKIDNAAAIIAWGDSVVWTNKDAVSYTLERFKPDPPNKTWVELKPDATSAPMVFNWSSPLGKDPVVYEYGMPPPGATATITAQISRF